MIFNTASYYLLFLIPAAVLFRVVATPLRPWVCVASGVAFFAFYSATQFGGRWGVACLLIFAWEASFRSFYRPGSWTCVAGIVVSVAVLAGFKYANFVTDLLFGSSQANPLHWSGAFLPLGVSFFTFEFIHYAADRRTGRVERGTLGEYLAFLFFFPTMVAGPIKRFPDFLACLRHPSAATALDWNRGVTRILAGLAKKFAAADLLTSLTDHLNRADIARAERWILPVWLVAYGWKIYFDFSAYSDIAIGSGRLFGITIPENFNWPYTRSNIAEFWRHWHISLSSWLVDYVFIPLGGSRGSSRLACRNIMIVMLVSGLWHGAGLNYLAWGAWHGTLLIAHRLWVQTARGVGRAGPGSGPWPQTEFLASWLLTQTGVTLGWAFFAMDLDTAVFFFGRLLGG